jgi:hypothetical protein
MPEKTKSMFWVVSNDSGRTFIESFRNRELADSYWKKYGYLFSSAGFAIHPDRSQDTSMESLFRTIGRDGKA